MAQWAQNQKLTTFTRVVVLIAFYFVGGLVGNHSPNGRTQLYVQHQKIEAELEIRHAMCVCNVQHEGSTGIAKTGTLANSQGAIGAIALDRGGFDSRKIRA